MADEIDISVVHKTQQKLGKYIQRPQLSEKLLRRPPFRFLHDIITTAIQQYGIADNVFTKEELISDNIKEKEAKIAFLQKLINYLSSQTGRELGAKPSKIVAGTEAQKTNDLLIALASVLEKSHTNKAAAKTPQNMAIDKSHANNPSPGHKVTKADMKIGQKSTDPTKVTVGNPISKVEMKNGHSLKVKEAKSGANVTPVKVKVAKSNSNKTEQVAKSNSIKAEQVSKDNDLNKRKSDSTSKSLTNSKLKSEGKLNDSHKSKIAAKIIDSVSVNEIKEEIEQINPVVEESIGRSAKIRKEIQVESSFQLDFGEQHEEEPVRELADPNFIMRDLLHDQDSLIVQPTPDPTPISIVPAQDDRTDVERDIIIRDNDSEPRKSASPNTRRTFDGPAIVNADMAKDIQSSQAQLTPPTPKSKDTFERPPPNQVRPPSSTSGLHPTRPMSSRRPPTRTAKDRLNTIRQENRPMTGQMPHVIIEGNPLSDDEEDKIIEAAVLDQAISDMSFLGNDIMAQGEQGKLVEQILLAQQEMAPLPETEQDSGSRNATAENQRLQSLIQEVAQAALPMGHLIPLVHEDLDIMHKEWQFWKREANSLQQQLGRQRSSADPSLEELRARAAQLDQVIQSEKVKLMTLKASVHRNEMDVALLVSNRG